MSRLLSILQMVMVLALAAQTLAAQPREIAVAFNGLEDEIAALAERLNDHGERRGLRFVRSPEGYQLRISVKSNSRSALASMPISPQMRVLTSNLDGSSAVLTQDYQLTFALDPSERPDIGSSAEAAVLTPNGALLFALERSGRRTPGGALNAVAKEIIKKLSQYEEWIPSTSISTPLSEGRADPPEVLSSGHGRAQQR